MAKQINFEYKGKEYCLEYTRETAKQLQREGFKASDLVDMSLIALPKLFSGAFKAHHKFGLKEKEIEEMYKLFTNKEALLEKLAEMYNAPLEELFDEPEDSGNAIVWDASF